MGQSIFGKALLRASLRIDLGQCLRLRHKKSGCRLCLDNCPSGAINFDGSLEVDDSLCHGCGVCVAVCPTDVFELRDLSYKSLLARVRGGSVVEFACSQCQQGQDSLKVPCLGYLSEAVLVGSIGCGAQAVRLNVTPCKDCDHAFGLWVAAKSLKQANRTLALFGIPERISAAAEEPDSSCSPAESKVSSRREFFSCLKEGAGVWWHR